MALEFRNQRPLTEPELEAQVLATNNATSRGTRFEDGYERAREELNTLAPRVVLRIGTSRAASSRATGLRSSSIFRSRYPSPSPAEATSCLGAVQPDQVRDLGLAEQSARQQLESAGFTVEVADEPTDDPDRDGLVVAQEPTGRSEKGATVTVTVARFT